MKPFYFYLLIIVVIFFNACNNGDDDGDQNQLSGNVVLVTKDITVPTTWDADSIYVIKDHDFWVTNSLTIEAGTTIKFSSDGMQMIVGNGGTIIASGTSQKPIIFTSIKDDSHGGDSNNDGTTTSPNAGDWGMIEVNSIGNTFTYCEFYYGGSQSYLSTLEIYGGRATIQYCTFANNVGGKDGDFYFGALAANDADIQTSIKNCVFYSNTLPLSINSRISIDNSNSFQKPGDANVKNKMNGIFISYTDHINSVVSWQETEVPFVIHDNDLWIDSPGSLQIGNNVIVKFTPGSTLLFVAGAGITRGTGSAFTSFKDDSRGGDTNGDGNVTSASNGDWNGIYDDGASVYVAWTNIYFDSY
jgi:hypothetical protein